MPSFFALVDAQPGREADVDMTLRATRGVLGVMRLKEGSYDFLLRFEEPSFDTVDDFLQTHVRPVPGVMGVEIVRDVEDYGPVVKEARDALEADAATAP